MRELREILCKYCEEFYSEPCRRSKERCTPRDQAITAIIELIKREMPEKEEHSLDCLYMREPRYRNDSSKEKYCDCGASDYNRAITEMHAVLDKIGGKE